MSKYVVVGLIGLSLLLGLPSLVSSIVITEKGKPKATVVIGENVTEIEKHAAVELVKYVKELSGAELEIISQKSKVRDEKKNIKTVYSSIGAWAYECGKNFIAGYFDELKVTQK